MEPTDLSQTGPAILTAPEDILRAMGIDEAASNMTDRDMGKDEKEVFDIVRKRGKITIDELFSGSLKDPFRCERLMP